MRAAHAAFLVPLLAVAVFPPAAAQGGILATLELDVQAEGREEMTLAFEGLRPLTRYDGICLPHGARESRVHDDLGDVQYEARDEDGRRVLSFLARGDGLSIDMARAGPEDDDHPIYAGDVNFCVPNESRVRVEIRVPEGSTLFFVSDPAASVSPREASVEHDGPLHLFYSYEAPLGGARPIQAFDEGPFRVFASPAYAPQARDVAQRAAGPLAAALEVAGLDAPFDTLRVLYETETPFPWEAGHYNGAGYVVVKEDTLVEDPTAGYPLSAAKVLVHEAFHAASFPYGKGDVEDSVSWWLEGTARHSERQVDAAMPNASIHCEQTSIEVKCWTFDDRIPRADLETGYRADFTFQPTWEPSAEQEEDTRRFYYAYSEYVVAAWIARHDAASYREAWDAVEAAFLRGEGCPCDEGWLEGILADDALFRPWDDVKTAEPARFETLVAPFVKDEAAVQRALDARAGPASVFPIPAWGTWAAIATLAALALARPTRR